MPTTIDPTKPPVLIPYRPDPWRRRLLNIVMRHYRRGGYPVVLGQGEHPGPFNRSAKVNEARRLADYAAPDGVRYPTLIVADGDVLPDLDALAKAVELSRGSGTLVYPFEEWRALDKRFTRRIVAEEARRAPLDDLGGPRWHEATTRTYPSLSGAFAIPTALYDAIGGFDERFEGWGWEDRAFYEAAITMGGIDRAPRLPGDLWHLWHPKSAEKDPTAEPYRRGRALRDRYVEASGDPDAMARILFESVPS